MLRIGIVAGEASGDRLGAELIRNLHRFHTDISVEGIAGEAMIEQGCRSLYPMEKLSVMGIFEVLRHYPELRSMQKNVIQYFIENPPDVFIGIDAPDFTLPIEQALKKHNIKTVHYVSPSVWAWRQGRLKGIKRSVDLMLALFPFEKKFYQEHQIPVSYVGHPLASEIAMENSAEEAQASLQLDRGKPYLALLPGSRKAEISRLASEFVATLKACQQRYPDLRGIVGLHNERARENFLDVVSDESALSELQIFVGQTQTVMAAATVLLIASGTATLEGMLIKRPMVVAYKANWLSYKIVMSMLKVPFVSLPNLLANKSLVPELLQGDCHVESLSKAVLEYLDNDNKVILLQEQFTQIHHSLQSAQAESAAEAVHQLIEQRA